MRRNTLVALSVGLKLSLFLMLGIAMLTDASAFQHKALGARLGGYGLGVAIVPIIWLLIRLRNKSQPFPFRIDILITLPFVIDTAGNWLNLFDTITWWDDIMHLTQWFWLMLGFAPLLVVRTDAKWRNALLIASTGALIAVLWEAMEYVTFVSTNTLERSTAYQDTIGDLLLGSIGALLAAFFELFVLRRSTNAT